MTPHSQSSFWAFITFILCTIEFVKMTLKGGTSQACAACKYQRRRCTSDCPLAPYFPPDQPKMFQNAHRLFGVSNILKILRQIDPTQRFHAMQSIIYQSNMRDKFPVYGCWTMIRQLYFQIQQAEQELHAVHTQLALMCRHGQNNEIISSSALNNVDSISQLQLGMAPPNNALNLFHQDSPQPNYNAALPIASSHHVSYSNGNNNNNNNNLCFNNSGYVETKDNNFWIQNTYNNGNINNNVGSPMPLMQSQLGVSQTLPIQQEAVQEYDELYPFFDTIDDRQSYIDSKEAYESSSESSLRDTTQPTEHVAENELKSAAACFSLTSVN